MTLKEKCQMTEQELKERQKTHQLELEAVSKSLAILSSDCAHDTFARRFHRAGCRQRDRARSRRALSS